MQINTYKLFSLLNKASIDVAAAAAIQLLALCYVFNEPMAKAFVFPLFAGTLLFYWLDHYLDYKQQKEHSNRHVFVHKHIKILVFLAIFLMLSAGYVVMPAILQKPYLNSIGIMILLLVIYAFVNQFKSIKAFTKEMLVSACYSYAICFPLIPYANRFNLCVVAFAIFVLVLQNMLMVNLHEQEIDRKNNSSNLTLVLSKKHIITLMRLLFVLQLGIVCCALFWLNQPMLGYYLLLLFGAAVVQQLLVGSKIAYRIIGEWAFALPVIIIFS